MLSLTYFCLLLTVMSSHNICGEDADIHRDLKRRVDFLQTALLRLKATVEQQQDEIELQKSEINKQKEINKIQDGEIKSLTKMRYQSNNVMDKSIRSVDTESPNSTAAFFAVKSNGETALADHTILFDKDIVNKGFAYNRYMGTFIAPRAGIYFFSWTIHSYVRSFISTRLMVNGKQMSAIFSDSEEVGDYHSATGVAILDLNIGDAIYIKSHPTHGQKGSILCTDFASCTFSGYVIN